MYLHSVYANEAVQQFKRFTWPPHIRNDSDRIGMTQNPNWDGDRANERNEWTRCSSCEFEICFRNYSISCGKCIVWRRWWWWWRGRRFVDIERKRINLAVTKSSRAAIRHMHNHIHIENVSATNEFRELVKIAFNAEKKNNFWISLFSRFFSSSPSSSSSSSHRLELFCGALFRCDAADRAQFLSWFRQHIHSEWKCVCVCARFCCPFILSNGINSISRDIFVAEFVERMSIKNSDDFQAICQRMVLNTKRHWFLLCLFSPHCCLLCRATFFSSLFARMLFAHAQIQWRQLFVFILRKFPIRLKFS